jgi:uncharacterized protein (DUF1800 family)
VVTVEVSPALVTLRTGDTQNFRAAVTGAADPSVTWAVNGVTGGNASAGTISATGLYTTPATLPSPNNVKITATSVADTTKSSSATATLLNPIAVVNFINPPELSPNAAFSLSVIGSKFVSGAQVMFGAAALATTFVDSSHLTATGTAQDPGVITVTVVNPQPDGAPSAAQSIAVAIVNSRAAVRLLDQSTFGASDAQLVEVEAKGMENFLATQFQASASIYPDPDPSLNDVSSVQAVFFQNAVNPAVNSDQLRQRTVFCLSQIWVVSGNTVNQPKFYTPYLRVLAADAFANYRTLMEDVTLNPGMGIYLNMADNAKPNPAAGTHANENYARELLQLFTLGPNLLNPDGTPVLQPDGSFVPTYHQQDIQALARAFTGWTFPGPPLDCANQVYNNSSNPLAGVGPMPACDNNHDVDPKTVLGTTLPGGQPAQKDLDAALDIIFHHPNLPPFIGQRFIRYFVTSNPSPAYVTRVASAFAAGSFNSNGATFGSGQRGDMQALIAAVLLDPEARRGDIPATENPLDGHLREPVLLIANVLRAFHGTTDGQNLGWVAGYLGETLFYAPSVFNFYAPTFKIPLTQPSLFGPEFQIYTTASSLNRVNIVEALIFSPSSVGPGTQDDLSDIAALGDPNMMLDALNLRLLHGTMSDPMRASILTAVKAVDSGNPLARAQTAAYLIVSSSHYQVQR